MILDAQLLFSDAQAVTAAAASTNTIDLSVARDLGAGRDVWVAINVDVAMTDGSSDSTLTVDLYFDSTTTFTPDAQQRLLIIPAVQAAGARFYVKVSPLPSTKYQYCQLYYTPNNGNLDTGTFTAGLVLDVQDNFAYADAITIS